MCEHHRFPDPVNDELVLWRLELAHLSVGVVLEFDHAGTGEETVDGGEYCGGVDGVDGVVVRTAGFVISVLVREREVELNCAVDGFAGGRLVGLESSAPEELRGSGGGGRLERVLGGGGGGEEGGEGGEKGLEDDGGSGVDVGGCGLGLGV